MIVEDLEPEDEKLYCMCLEDWSEEIKEAGDHKEKWYARMKDQGLGVKIARNDSGVIGGMIHYAPIEHTFVQGKDLYFIFCIYTFTEWGISDGLYIDGKLVRTGPPTPYTKIKKMIDQQVKAAQKGRR